MQSTFLLRQPAETLTQKGDRMATVKWELHDWLHLNSDRRATLTGGVSQHCGLCNRTTHNYTSQKDPRFGFYLKQQDGWEIRNQQALPQQI